MWLEHPKHRGGVKVVGMFRRCKHERVRCIHGDEILVAMTLYRARIRRQRCLDCGRALDRGLPDPCTVNGQPHASQRP